LINQPIKTHNPFPDLVELKLSSLDLLDCENAQKLKANLRFGPYNIVGVDFAVSLRKARLVISPSGFEVKEHNKFGDSTKALAIRYEYKHQSESSNSKGAQASVEIGIDAAAAPSIGAKIAAHIDRGTKEIATHSLETEIDIARVVPRGGNSWEFSEPTAPQILDGKYIDSSDNVLCEVQAQQQSNSRSVQAYVEIRQRDLALPPDVKNAIFGNKKPTNNERIFKILLAKSLHSEITKHTGEEYEGKVMLSLVEISNEDNLD
jgi:hypothetical protein